MFTSGLDEKAQEFLVGGTDANAKRYARFEAAEAAGYSPEAFYKMLTAVDTNGNGEYTQSELTPYLDASGMSMEERDALWEIIGGGWKTPYKPKTK